MESERRRAMVVNGRVKWREHRWCSIKQRTCVNPALLTLGRSAMTIRTSMAPGNGEANGCAAEPER